MLHASQDAPCSALVRFWNSPAGEAEFRALVAARVDPPPAPDDPEVLRTLRAAVPRNLVVADDAQVDARVLDAARGVADRLRLTREMVARHHDFVHRPQPARFSVYAGVSDRGGGELAPRLPANPHYARWLANAS